MAIHRSTEERIRRELAGDKRIIRAFEEVEDGVAYFFRVRNRGRVVPCNTNYADWKDWTGAPDPDVAERERRTFHALAYCFREVLPGECRACDAKERCPPGVKAKHSLTPHRRWLLEQIYGLHRGLVHVADQLGTDERKVQHWIELALEIIRKRMVRRRLLRRPKRTANG